jgi:hypothetical protein
MGLLMLSQQTWLQAETQEQGSHYEQESDSQRFESPSLHGTIEDAVSGFASASDSEEEVDSNMRDPNTLSVLAFPDSGHDGENAWSQDDVDRDAGFALLRLSRESATVLEIARQESFGLKVADTRIAPAFPSHRHDRFRGHHHVITGRGDDGDDYHYTSHFRRPSPEDTVNSTNLLDSDSEDGDFEDNGTEDSDSEDIDREESQSEHSLSADDTTSYDSDVTLSECSDTENREKHPGPRSRCRECRSRL